MGVPVVRGWAFMVGQEVLDAFGLAPLELQRVEEGCINRTWRVVTGSGEFALRQHRTTHPAAIAAEQAVMRAAHLRGLPVPHHISTRRSEPFLTDAAGRIWSLAVWLPGTVVTPEGLSADLAFHLGETVARVHGALGRLSPSQFPVAPQHSAMEPIQALEKFALFRHLIGLRDRQEAFDEFAASYFDQIEPRLRAGSPALAYHRTAAGQVLHGDLWFQNVLFEAGQITGVLDWEYASVAPRVWELGYVFGCWLLVPTDYVRTEQLTCAFVEGYGSVADLSPAEAGLVPEMYRWFRMNHVGPFFNHYVLGDSRTNQFLAGNLRQVQFIEAAGPDLRERLEQRVKRLRRRR